MIRRMRAWVGVAVLVAACGGGSSGDDADASIDGPDEGGDAGVDATVPPADARDVAGSLTGLRWELPCLKEIDAYVCRTTSPATVLTATMGGHPGTTYDVELRFRGAVEERGYTGGTADGLWYVGGIPAADDLYNVYSLQISDPPQVYYLNAGESGHAYIGGIDYTHTVQGVGGATITLTADPTDDAQIKNRTDPDAEPVIPEGVPPAPAAYDGQFVQMDVVSVTER